MAQEMKAKIRANIAAGRGLGVHGNAVKATPTPEPAPDPDPDRPRTPRRGRKEPASPIRTPPRRWPSGLGNSPPSTVTSDHPKGHTMRTKTNSETDAAPMTAAEARALAEQLGAAESDRDRRKAPTRKAAEIAALKSALDVDVPKHDGARDAAEKAWSAAVADPEVGVAELFTRWQEMRVAFASRTVTVEQANAALNAWEPLFNKFSTVQVPHRMDTHDRLAHATFTAALDGVIAQRVNAASEAQRGRVQTGFTRAGQKAADAIA